MKITAVRVQLAEDHRDTLRAYCSIEIDGVFAVKDLKVIETDAGHFVAMPNRVATQKCTACNARMDVRANFCSSCGSPVLEREPPQGDESGGRLFADIAHPITPKCREQLEAAVLAAYARKLETSRKVSGDCLQASSGRPRAGV